MTTLKDTFTREELLQALRIEPCHTTGMHDPNHTARYVCDGQRAIAYHRLLGLLGVTEDQLPRVLHPECGWCHEVPSQERYRVQRRELHAWAGVPIPPALAEPAPDAEVYHSLTPPTDP